MSPIIILLILLIVFQFLGLFYAAVSPVGPSYFVLSPCSRDRTKAPWNLIRKKLPGKTRAAFNILGVNSEKEAVLYVTTIVFISFGFIPVFNNLISHIEGFTRLGTLTLLVLNFYLLLFIALNVAITTYAGFYLDSTIKKVAAYVDDFMKHLEKNDPDLYNMGHEAIFDTVLKDIVDHHKEVYSNMTTKLVIMATTFVQAARLTTLLMLAIIVYFLFFS